MFRFPVNPVCQGHESSQYYVDQINNTCKAKVMPKYWLYNASRWEVVLRYYSLSFRLYRETCPCPTTGWPGHCCRLGTKLNSVVCRLFCPLPVHASQGQQLAIITIQHYANHRIIRQQPALLMGDLGYKEGTKSDWPSSLVSTGRFVAHWTPNVSTQQNTGRTIRSVVISGPKHDSER